MTAQNPMAVLDEEDLQRRPTLGQLMNTAVQNTQDSLRQTANVLTGPQAMLAGLMQPIQGMTDLAGDPQDYFQKQLAGLLQGQMDPLAAERRRKARDQRFMQQGQQDYMSGMQAVQIPTGGFVGGPNRGLI